MISFLKKIGLLAVVIFACGNASADQPSISCETKWRPVGSDRFIRECFVFGEFIAATHIDEAFKQNGFTLRRALPANPSETIFPQPFFLVCLKLQCTDLNELVEFRFEKTERSAFEVLAKWKQIERATAKSKSRLSCGRDLQKATSLSIYEAEGRTILRAVVLHECTYLYEFLEGKVELFEVY